MFELAHGRKVLVTGGASGIGRGTAERFLECGASVAVADVNVGGLAELLRSVGNEVVVTPLDVRNATDVKETLVRVAEQLGGLDTVVNCAGIIRLTYFEDITEAEWDEILDVNLKGTFLVCQAALPFLRASGRGRIINVASVAGKRGGPLLAPYVSSKFGVVGLTEVLALECGGDGLTVNAVLPGNTPDTGMGRQVLQRRIALGYGESEAEIRAATIAAAFPLGRTGEVADAVNAIMFLASDGANFVNGHALVVDGGSLATSPGYRSGSYRRPT
jgi:meso-butanediol dehydrogenase/(S,S)-butanediol dehydrogenase/diacetyl reductase